LLLGGRERVVLHDHVGRDAATAVHRTTGVRLEEWTCFLAGLGLEGVARRVLDELAVHELALALNRPAAGGIPLCRRELERIAAVEVEDRLHESLAEGRLADDDGAIVILQRPGDDLARRRRAFVR